MIKAIFEIIKTILGALSGPRKPSQPTRIKNLEIIKRHEGLRLRAYLPTPNDRWTIGYGHTSGVKNGMVITEARAEELLLQDVAWVQDALNTSIKVPVTQNQYDALGSFVFNLGATNLRNSTLLKKLNAGDYEGAANEFLKWNKQRDKRGHLHVLPGLTKRRAEERDLFLRGMK